MKRFNPIILWLDDIRNPYASNGHLNPAHGHTTTYQETYEKRFGFRKSEMVWVTGVSDFKDWIMSAGLPDAICFDHDLGPGPSGMDAAKWLVEYCLDRNLDLPAYDSQSDNPVGKNNIISYLNNYTKSRR